MKKRRIGFVMDPIEAINPKKDTTLAFMLEAQRRGWRVGHMTMGDLSLVNGQAMGNMRYVRLYDDASRWFETKNEEYCALSELDMIMMRKDPPFDMEYVMATYILERAEEEGAFVVNKPRSLRDVNEKVFTAWIPACCPPSLFSRSRTDIRRFAQQHGKIVLKPTGKMGGRSVFIIANGDPNANVIIEELTQYGTVYVQAQAYLPEIVSSGDKRIILINGEALEQAIARIPGPDDHRGNMAVGAKASPIMLSERDKWLCAQIGPILRDRGLYFVGIDVIGDHITEINVTSPTGLREIDAFFSLNTSSIVFDALEDLLEQKNKKIIAGK
ncbi:MAG: glutathione synthase [Sphingobacteriales bacterium]|jgi:glutathione synthase